MNQAPANITIMDIELEKMILSQKTDMDAIIRVATNCLIIFELSCFRSSCDADFCTQ